MREDEGQVFALPTTPRLQPTPRKDARLIQNVRATSARRRGDARADSSLCPELMNFECATREHVRLSGHLTAPFGLVLRSQTKRAVAGIGHCPPLLQPSVLTSS